MRRVEGRAFVVDGCMSRALPRHVTHRPCRSACRDGMPALAVLLRNGFACNQAVCFVCAADWRHLARVGHLTALLTLQILHRVAFFAGNHSDALAAANEVNTVRITQQILANGSQWIELERSNPAGYCQYNLEAYASIADQAVNTGLGVDNWGFKNKQGGSIRGAIDFLLPYATGKEKWPYSQIEPATWGGMFEVFRRASIAYNSRE